MSVKRRIETERLVLRLPRMDDARAIFDGYAQDPDVTRYLSWKPHESIEDTTDFLRKSIGHSPEERIVWIIEMKETGELMGTINLDFRCDQAEAGFAIAKRFWNRGFVAEALKAVIEEGFAREGLKRIIARCDAGNKASARVMEKAGMSRDGGVLRGAKCSEARPEPRDLLQYAVERK